MVVSFFTDILHHRVRIYVLSVKNFCYMKAYRIQAQLSHIILMVLVIYFIL